MKSAQELATGFRSSPAEQKKQATALRRLAGGLKATAERKDLSGLTGKEVKKLLDAVDVLNGLANNHTKAQKLSQANEDAQREARQAVRAAMQDNFDTLVSIADRVALIGATSAYLLRDNFIQSSNDLDRHFRECLDSLCYRFAGKVPERTPQDVVAENWATFQSHRVRLQDKHASTIGQLTLASDRNKQSGQAA